ncbi:hypothetical protein ACFL0O_00305 [Thermodesulfobacteriota bacterium]
MYYFIAEIVEGTLDILAELFEGLLYGVKALLIVVAWLIGHIAAMCVNFIEILTGQVNRRPAPRQNYTPQPVYQPPPQPAQQSYEVQPSLVYHGTSEENAWEIFNTGFWLVGDSRPYGIYLTDDFETARGYSNNDGLIVTVIVAPAIELVDRSGGIWLYPMPNAKPHEKYHKIEGLHPFELRHPLGKRVA